MPRSVRVIALLAPVLGAAWLLHARAAPATFPVTGVSRWGTLADGVAALAAAALCVRAGTRPGNWRGRAAWTLHGLGCALWALAPLDWLLGLPGWWGALGIGDLGRAGFLVCVAAGLVLTFRGPDHRALARMLLDAAAVASVVFVLVWAVLGEPVRARAHHVPLLAAAHLAFPLGAVVLLIFCLLLALTEFLPGRRRMPLLFIAGLAAIALADARIVARCAFGDPTVTAVDSAAWLSGFALLGASAAVYRGTTGRRVGAITSRWIAYLPYALVIPMTVALVVQAVTIHHVPLPEIAASGLVFLIVLGRQVLLLAQNRALLAVLADRERDLSHQARHDSLTGLGNRALLVERLQAALSGPAGPADPAASRSLSLLLCDLDDFKAINDTLGHDAGDELLVLVADRLLVGTRDTDTVVRLGGDEFAIVLDRGQDEALRVARDLRQAFQEPFHVAGHRLPLSASIGVVNLDARDGSVTVAELLKGADLAMYEAKRRGKNDVQLFTPALRPEAAATLRLREELAVALEQGDLTVVYQPLASASDGRVVAVEALVRWVHPQLGPIPPHECLAAAGRGRLVAGLTDAVLTAVAADLVRWTGFPETDGLGTCVNLSAAQLADPTLLERLAAVLDLAGRESGSAEPRLTVEITEPGALEDLDIMAQRLAAVRELGCGVALDGFGAGCCALTPLTVLPIDVVKIDLAVVRDLDRFERLVAAVRAVTRGRGVRTVAEGVETTEQRDAARRAGCDLIQGFVLSPPVPASQLRPVLQPGPRGVGHQRRSDPAALSEPQGRSG